MATRPARKRAAQQDNKPSKPELDSEFAHRLRDPFETTFQGVLQTNDPLLLERGHGQVDLYKDLRRDGKVFGGMQKRQLALIGKPWQVEPVDSDGESDSAAAETVTKVLKGFAFDKLCQDLLEALLTGFTVAEIVWTIKDGLVVPERVIKRAQKRFKFVQEDERAPVWLHLLTRESMVKGVPVPDRKFIVHSVNPEDGNPYGTGLGLQLYWPVFFKRKGIVAWNKLCDRFGAPTPHGKYPRNASPKEKSTLADALRAMTNDGFVMTPDGMEIGLLESKLTGNVTTQQALCNYMDDWIAEVLTGQEPRQSGGGALAAAAEERQDVRQDLTQADSDLLSDTLNQTLIKWICEYNGLEACTVYRAIKKDADISEMTKADKDIYDMGFELDEDQAKARYGEGWRRRVNPPPASAAAADGDDQAVPGANEAPADIADAEAKKLDASAINAYSMGIERIAKMGVDVPQDHIRKIFDLPAPRAGETLLKPTAPGVAAEESSDTKDEDAEGDDDKRTRVASFAEGAVRQESDMLDRLVEAERGEWQPLLADMTSPIQALLDDAVAQGLSAAELLERLPALLPAVNADPLQQRLTGRAFLAHLLARAGVDNQ